MNIYNEIDPYWIDMVKDIMIDTKVPDRYSSGKLGYNNGFSDYSAYGYYMSRRLYCHLCSWALISNQFVNNLYKYLLRGKKVLSLYSGRGLLEYFLRGKGVDIIATDDGSWYNPESDEVKKYRSILQEVTGISVGNQRRRFIKDIKIIGAEEAVEKYVKDVDYILVSWVPFEDEEIINVLESMRKLNPKCRMIWIGESDFGCNGCDEFFEIVDYEDSVEIDLINNHFQSWEGIHDSVYLYK